MKHTHALVILSDGQTMTDMVQQKDLPGMAMVLKQHSQISSKTFLKAFLEALDLRKIDPQRVLI